MRRRRIKAGLFDQRFDSSHSVVFGPEVLNHQRLSDSFGRRESRVQRGCRILRNVLKTGAERAQRPRWQPKKIFTLKMNLSLVGFFKESQAAR